MSKIICEICGTSYPDTAGSCPICGWTNKASAPEDLDLDGIRKDFLDEQQPAPSEEPAEKKNRVIFDYDAVNTNKAPAARSVPNAQVEAEGEDEDEEEAYLDEEEEPHTNVALIVFLAILIVALLLTTGYLFVRFFLPGKEEAPETTAPPATAQIVETIPESTEAPTIACSDLAIPDGIEELKEPGQMYLLHVVALPEDTTDTITYASENEAVATVDAEGKVTAVAEGETNIIVTCGQQSIKCPVKVHFEPETQPTEAVVAQPEPTETTAAESGAPAKKDVVIKLKKTDITLGRLGVYVDLQLDCDLTPEEVEWSSDNIYVASVSNGRVTVTGRGIATITAKYGDHTATCVVRCKY